MFEKNGTTDDNDEKLDGHKNDEDNLTNKKT